MNRHWKIASTAIAVVTILLGVVSQASAITVTHDACGVNNAMPSIRDPQNPVMKRPAFHSDCPTYKGWGHVSAVDANSCIWAGCRMAVTARFVTGYHWEGNAWHAHQIPVDDWVYAWPYGSGWSWAYHYNTGTWVAMRSDHITIYAETIAL